MTTKKELRPKLLTRQDFKKLVFQRDKMKCIFCTKDAVDAHHILDRKLFPDGGYYLDNGASVCEAHHWDCEEGRITVEQVRERCKIKIPVLPPGLLQGVIYDKWGKSV